MLIFLLLLSLSLSSSSSSSPLLLSTYSYSSLPTLLSSSFGCRIYYLLIISHIHSTLSLIFISYDIVSIVHFEFSIGLDWFNDKCLPLLFFFFLLQNSFIYFELSIWWIHSVRWTWKRKQKGDNAVTHSFVSLCVRPLLYLRLCLSLAVEYCSI